MRSQQHPPEPPPRRPPSLPFPQEFGGQSLGLSASDELPWADDPRVRIVAWGITDLAWRPSRWRRFVRRVQHLGRSGIARWGHRPLSDLQRAAIDRAGSPVTLLPGGGYRMDGGELDLDAYPPLTDDERSMFVEADPIESFPEADPMRPSLDLSEVDVAQYPKHYARCRSKECPCYLAGYDAAYDQADAIAGYGMDGKL